MFMRKTGKKVASSDRIVQIFQYLRLDDVTRDAEEYPII